MFRVEFMKPFGPPTVWPFTIPIVAATQLSQVERKDNIWVVPNREGTDIAAISLDWEYGNEDMEQGYWQPDDVVDQTYVNTVTDLKQTELDTVTARILASTSPDEDDLYRQWELTDEIDRLARHRFWVTKNNAFGDGCDALYRAVTTANVPWKLTSADTVVGKNQAFTLHIYRFKHDPAQARKRLRIRWGQFILEFPSEGPGAMLYVVNPQLTEDQIADMTEDWEALEDKRTLTPTEQTQIEDWRQQIELIKQTARDDTSRFPAGLTQAEEGQVATLKAQIEALKASKGLTPAEAQEMKDLEADLYVSRGKADLGMAAQTSMGIPIIVTFIADPRGYLVLHTQPGNSVSIHEFKTITKTKQFGTVWPLTKLTLDSDGGAFFFRLSYPRVAAWGQLDSRDYHLGFEPGDISWSYQSWTPTGTSMTPTAIPGSSGLRWNLELTSDGRQFPFVYTLTMEAAAEPRERDDAVVNVVYGDRVVDWVPQHEQRRRHGTLTIRAEAGDMDWLADRENYQVRIYDRERVVFTGVVRNPSRQDLGGIRRAQVWTIMVMDRWGLFVGDLMWNEPPGDAKTFAAYAKQIAMNRGFEDGEVLVVDTGLLLPSAPAGQKYALMPKQGADRSQWLDEITDNHGLGYTMRFDALGRLIIGPASEIANPTYSFVTKRSMTNNPKLVVGGVERTWDFEDFRNLITVLGARDPDTGLRYSSRWPDWRSVQDDKYPYYVGEWRQLPPVEDEGLTSQDDCDIVCRTLWEQHGTPRFRVKFEAFYHDELREQDWVFLDGQPVEIERINRASRRDDRMEMEVLEVR